MCSQLSSEKCLILESLKPLLKVDLLISVQKIKFQQLKQLWMSNTEVVKEVFSYVDVLIFGRMRVLEEFC